MGYKIQWINTSDQKHKNKNHCKISKKFRIKKQIQNGSASNETWLSDYQKSRFYNRRAMLHNFQFEPWSILDSRRQNRRPNRSPRRTRQRPAQSGWEWRFFWNMPRWVDKSRDPGPSSALYCRPETLQEIDFKKARCFALENFDTIHFINVLSWKMAWVRLYSTSGKQSAMERIISIFSSFGNGGKQISTESLTLGNLLSNCRVICFISE